MSIFNQVSRCAPGRARTDIVAPISLKAKSLKGWFRSSVAPLCVLTCLPYGAMAQTSAPAAAKPDSQSGSLGPVVVTAPKHKLVRRVQAGTERSRTAVRRAGHARSREAVLAPGPNGAAAPATPLNLNTVADSASRLGLTAREIPATVEVIDSRTIADRGFRTTTDIAQGATGVTAGDAPGAVASFSMRGFTGTQINTLYNGIKIGPSEMTGRIMDTFNLDRVEILKGPASLLSGEGATGGAINYVTKTPHTGPITSEAFTSYDSFHGYRAGYGSGGSTLIDGLDYRFDISHTNDKSFIDDTYSRLSNVSGQLNYKVNDSFKIWGAFEYKQDKDRYYWGTPLVPANYPGIVPTTGIVSGLWSNYYLNGHTGPLNPVTIDARTLNTTYNVLDNHSGANELWLRSGFQWDITNNIQLKSQVYAYDAQRHWFNNEINSFDDSPGGGQVYRERLSVDHDQKLYGNVTDLTINSNLFGFDNRLVTTLSASSLQFNVVQDDFFNSDFVNLINPDRGLYGPQQTKNFYTHVDNVALAFEDRIKLTRNFALIGGIRMEDIRLSRTAFDVDGNLRSAAGYPFATTFTPVTGRVGYYLGSVAWHDVLQPVCHRRRSDGREYLQSGADRAAATDHVADL